MEIMNKEYSRKYQSLMKKQYQQKVLENFNSFQGKHDAQMEAVWRKICQKVNRKDPKTDETVAKLISALKKKVNHHKLDKFKFQFDKLEKAETKANTFKLSNKLEYFKERIKDIHSLQRLVHDGLPMVLNKHDRFILKRLGEKFNQNEDPNSDKALNKEIFRMLDTTQFDYVPVTDQNVYTNISTDNNLITNPDAETEF